MGLDDNSANWNKENYSTTFGKRPNFSLKNAGTNKKFEPLPRKFSFKIIGYTDSDLINDDPNDPWTQFKKKFIIDDEKLTDSDIFNELLELCSWYDPSESDVEWDDDDGADDEELEMIKRNLNSQMKYSSPLQMQQQSSSNTSSSVKLIKHSSSLNLSSLRLSSSSNLSKRRQMDDSNPFSCPNKRQFTPLQSHRKSSMNLDEAISCAAQNLDVDLPSFVISPPPSTVAASSTPLERKNSDFWNEMDSVTF